MSKSRKNQLLITLILACICTPALGTEPNEAKTELKFETSDQKITWTVPVGKTKDGRVLLMNNPGPIKPTHVAELSIKESSLEVHFTYTELTKAILKSHNARSMSQEQRDFLATEFAVRLDIKTYKVPNYYQFWLYAVSQEDTKKMAEAVIEILTDEADARMKKLTNRQRELQEKIPNVKKKLEEKLAEIKTTWDKLREKFFKEGPHSLKDYNEPVIGLEQVKEAKETIRETYRKLDALNVEIEGIEAKLLAIEEYKAKKNVGTNILAKLEQILCEQTIELAGAWARKKAALAILMREKEFYNLNKKCEKAAHEANQFNGELSSYESRLRDTKEKLSNPTPDMLPPKLYQNKVTIHPVRVDE